MECSFNGCDRLQYTKNIYLCQAHYQQQNQGKELTPIGSTLGHAIYGPDAQCTYEGCTTKPKSKGMCNKHYNYVRYHEGKDVEMDALERLCSKCRTVKRWTQMVIGMDSTQVICRDCYRDSLLPGKPSPKKTVSLEDMLRLIPADIRNCNNRDNDGV